MSKKSSTFALAFGKEVMSDLSHNAAIAQLVEHDLAKVGVASSSLVCRSFTDIHVAAMVELVDTRDLKSLGQ